jgi:hypothetical protein
MDDHDPVGIRDDDCTPQFASPLKPCFGHLGITGRGG